MTPTRKQQADVVRRMGLWSDGTQIRRRRGGAYRERCSGDARRAVRLLSRVKIGISVSAPPILSRLCGALCCCITLSCRRHSLPLQEMPRQIDGTEIAQVHSCEQLGRASLRERVCQDV